MNQVHTFVIGRRRWTTIDPIQTGRDLENASSDFQKFTVQDLLGGHRTANGV
jgi:hypothetical protein